MSAYAYNCESLHLNTDTNYPGQLSKIDKNEVEVNFEKSIGRNENRFTL